MQSEKEGRKSIELGQADMPQPDRRLPRLTGKASKRKSEQTNHRRCIDKPKQTSKPEELSEQASRRVNPSVPKLITFPVCSSSHSLCPPSLLQPPPT